MSLRVPVDVDVDKLIPPIVIEKIHPDFGRRPSYSEIARKIFNIERLPEGASSGHGTTESNPEHKVIQKPWRPWEILLQETEICQDP